MDPTLSRKYAWESGRWPEIRAIDSQSERCEKLVNNSPGTTTTSSYNVGFLARHAALSAVETSAWAQVASGGQPNYKFYAHCSAGHVIRPIVMYIHAWSRRQAGAGRRERGAGRGGVAAAIAEGD